MARTNKIKRLPREIQDMIGNLREQGRTIDEILAKLKELDVQIARSTLGEHIKQIDAAGEEIRRSRVVSEALVSRYGDAPESKTARLNVELMHALILKLLVSEEGKSIELGPKDTMLLSMALQKLAQTSKQDVELAKIIEELKDKIKARAKATAENAAGEMKRAGLSPETIKKIETEILGIAR